MFRTPHKSMNDKASNVGWISLFKRTADAWMADKALRLSAALAYYSVFSIAPLLVITIGVAGLVFGDEAVTGDLQKQMKGYVGSSAAKVLESMVESAAKPSEGMVASITGFVMLMLGASGVFGALKDALNTIWEVKPKPGSSIRALAFDKFLNFGMVLVIGFLLLISLVMSTAIASLHHRLEVIFVLPAFVWTAAAFGVSMLVTTTLFAWIFKVLPDVRTQWRDVWTGALLTAVLFEIGKTGLSWYLGRESTANAYGAAGSVVLLLLWVYYASCILLFGAEFTRVYAQAAGRFVAPSAGAAWVTPEERLLEGMDEPQAGSKRSAGAVPAAHFFASPLLAPVLKYVEGRGTLLSIEAKEAFRQILGLLALLVAVCVVLFAGWLVLVSALVEWLAELPGWDRLTASLAAGGGHVLLGALVGFWIWRKLTTASWFRDTLNEFRKDRTWLHGHKTR